MTGLLACWHKHSTRYPLFLRTGTQNLFTISRQARQRPACPVCLRCSGPGRYTALFEIS